GGPGEMELVEAAGDLLKGGLLPVERIPALVDVGQLHVVADAELSGVGLLLAGDHPEQRGLAGSVRSDDPDDATGRKLEAQVLHQQPVAVCLADPARLHHEAGELGPGRDGDLTGGVALLLAGRQQLLVRGDTRLALGLPGTGAGPNPLQLALELLLAGRLGLLLHLQPLLLLLEPAGVVALPGDALA